MASRSRHKPGRQRLRPASPSPPTLGWKDRLSISAWVVLPVLTSFFLVGIALKARWQASMDSRLATWQRAYQLDEVAVERLRRLELEFHGSGNPPTTPVRRTLAETRIHQEEIAQAMEDSQGKKFLQDLEAGRIPE